MKRILFIVLQSFITLPLLSQTLISLKGGIGVVTKNTSDISPAYGIECLQTVARHLYLGASLMHEQYSFTRNDEQYYQFGGVGYSLTQTSNYLYLMPKLDVGIGHGEYIHFFVTAGPGIMLSGTQHVALINPGVFKTGVYPGLQEDTGNTSRNITHHVFRFGFGITGHIPIFPNWVLSVTPEIGIIPSWVSKNSYGYFGDQSMNIKTNYFSFTIGILYKYHWSPYQPARTWGGY